MHSVATIDETIAQAVFSTIGRDRVDRVLVKPTADSQGEDAFNVTIVIYDADELTGDDALDAISQVSQALRKLGDDRIAITSFATEADLIASVDPED